MEDLICFSWIVGLLNSFRCPAICIREDPESIINGIPERLVSGWSTIVYNSGLSVGIWQCVSLFLSLFLSTP